MEARSSDEAKTNIENFTNEYLDFLEEKERLKEELKEIKQKFKEEGVPVSVVAKVITRSLKLKKQTQSEIFEEELIQEWLGANPEIDNKIGALAAK